MRDKEARIVTKPNAKDNDKHKDDIAGTDAAGNESVNGKLVDTKDEARS